MCISGEILKISKTKKIYRNLYKKSFEKKINSQNKYDLVSLIGAMTYCADHNCLFKLVNNYLIKGGLFIFTKKIKNVPKFTKNGAKEDRQEGGAGPPPC